MSEILKDTTANKIGTGDGGLSLDPAGTETVTISNGVVIPDGTKAAPSIRLSDDTNTGIYSPTNDSISFVANGEDGLRVTGSPSAVNYTEVVSSATGADLVIKAVGTDTNIDIDIQSKGAGNVLINGAAPLTGSVTASQIDAEASTDGYVLTSDGAGNAAWEVVPAGGSVALNDLTDVVITTPSTDQVLAFDGSSWVNTTSSGGSSTLATLTDVTLASVGSHRYWRWSVTAVGDGETRSVLTELEMHTSIGGADVCSGGTPFTSNFLSGYDIPNAFDDNTSTWFNSDIAVVQFGYDFGVGNDQAIVEYKMFARAGFESRTPYTWTFEYSDDNSNWTVVDTQTAFSGHSSSGVNFSFPTGPANGDVLTYNSTSEIWENVTPTVYISDITGESIADLSDVYSSMSPTDGQVLTYDTTNGWQAEDASGGDPYLVINASGTLPSGTGNDSILIGASSTTGAATNSIAIGLLADASYGNSGVALGYNCRAGSDSVSIGNGNWVNGSNCVGIGPTADCYNGTDSVAIGFHPVTGSRARAIAIGRNVTVNNADSIAIGNTCTSSGDANVAIGWYVTNSSANSVRMGNSTTNVIHLKDLGRLHLEGAQAGYVLPGYASGSEPTAVEGQVVWDSTNKKIIVYNGTSWETVTSA